MSRTGGELNDFIIALASDTGGTNILERMRVTYDGLVGIGKTNPITTLDVAGSATISGSVRARSTNLSGQYYLGDGTAIRLVRDNSYDLSLIQGESSSNVLYLGGAGDVVVAIDTNNNDTAKRFAIGHDTTKPASGYLFSVLESGNVGIGTDTPQSYAGVNKMLHLANNSHVGIVLEDTSGGGSAEMWVDKGTFKI